MPSIHSRAQYKYCYSDFLTEIIRSKLIASAMRIYLNCLAGHLNGIRFLASREIGQMFQLKRRCLFLCSTMSTHRKRPIKRLFYGVGAVLFVLICVNYTGKWKEVCALVLFENATFKILQIFYCSVMHNNNFG